MRLKILLKNVNHYMKKLEKNKLQLFLEIYPEIINKDWFQFNKKWKNLYKEVIDKKTLVDLLNQTPELLNIYPKIRDILTMKPVRTQSGVSIITVFTKPYFCSGNCIFCPNIKNMPKSYLPDEPAAQRALQQKFNPYKQVLRRLEALKFNLHNTDKCEIIISGGTWDDYEKSYLLYFVTNIFSALNHNKYIPLNKTNWDKLIEQQKINEISGNRCVGLSIETRPDKINKENLEFCRKLGVTKIQIGIQTLNDKILIANNRGHNSNVSYKAVNLIRSYGYKIQIHWMPNLYKSTLEQDFSDFKKLYAKNSIFPDEIKIYPCSILKDTILYELYKKGKYKPYSKNELIDLLVKCKVFIPEYTRITRLFRDIPSNNILDGVKDSNLREEVQKLMKMRKLSCNCIRCREIKNERFNDYQLSVINYHTNISTEYFIQAVSDNNKLLGYLRLSLYKKRKRLGNNYCKAMIREIHVYGKSLNINEKSTKHSQHKGIGKKLLIQSFKIAKEQKINALFVISAIGTRKYYKKFGFSFENSLSYGVKYFS